MDNTHMNLFEQVVNNYIAVKLTLVNHVNDN